MILATTSRLDALKEQQFNDCGIRIWKMDGPNGQVDLQALMRRLGAEGIDSVLMEGGGNLNAAALEIGIVDKIMFFIAPRILGGKQAISPVEGIGRSLMRDALRLERLTMTPSGEDWLAEAYPDNQPKNAQAQEEAYVYRNH